MARVQGYKGDVISDWSLIKPDTKQGRVLMRNALNHFVNLPNKYPAIRQQAQAFARTGEVKPIQAFATGDDFPPSITEVLEKFNQTTYYDIGYEEVFNMRDMRNMKRSSFDVLDVTSGLTFATTEIGGKALLFKMSGGKETVSVDIVSGGLHWSKILFDDEEYWTLEDNAVQFRNKFYSSKAQAYYDLIDATSATYDLTWQASKDTLTAGTQNYVAQRDVATINVACVNIITQLQNLGMGIGPASTFIILAPLQLKGRITDALTNQFQSYEGSPNRLMYNIRPIYSNMLGETDVYYVIFPKNKIIAANRMDLTILTDINITTYSELAVGWARYGGCIAEEKQLSRCSTA